MDQKEKYVLVLGSKPESMFPDIEVKKIFAANGAAEKASLYLKKYPNIKLTSIVGGREFEKNLDVQNRVLNSDISEIISRSGLIKFENFDFKNKINSKCFTFQEQIKFQSNFFIFGILNIMFAECLYEKNFFMKIKHIIKSLKKGTVNGISTGFFSILYALNESNSKVIISGIGMGGGGHFYNEYSNRYSNRAKVDKNLIMYLKKQYKNRLYTVDKELEKNANIKYLNIKLF